MNKSGLGFFYKTKTILNTDCDEQMLVNFSMV